MQKEIKYLNVARGILICLVVMGHIDSPDEITRYIYLFHIAALIYLSGYFTKVDTSSLKSCLKQLGHRIGKLYFYYLKYELLFLVFKNLFFKVGFYQSGVDYGGKFIEPDSLFTFLKSAFFIVIGMGREVFAGAFWYFITLIFIVIIFTVIKYVSDKQKFINIEISCSILVVGAFLIGCLFNYLDIRLPRFAQAFTLMLPFYFGYLQSHGILRLSYDKPLLVIVAAVALGVMSRYGSISLNENSFPDPLFFCLASFFGIYMVLGLSKMIEANVSCICNVFRYLGKNSVAIMIFHLFAFKIVFLLQYALNIISFQSLVCLTGLALNPGWYVLFLLAGTFGSIGIFKFCEYLFSLPAKVIPLFLKRS